MAENRSQHLAVFTSSNGDDLEEQFAKWASLYTEDDDMRVDYMSHSSALAFDAVSMSTELLMSVVAVYSLAPEATEVHSNG